MAILVAIHFATPFATKNDREHFVEISSKISLLQLKFDEISAKFWTKFRRFFCGKMFCHNEIFVKTREGTKFCLVAKRFATIFATKKIVEISSMISLLQFKF